MSWRRTHSATMAHKQNCENKKKKVTAEEMLAASYYNGVGFQAVKSIMNMTGHSTQSRATFFRKEAQCEQKIVDCAKDLALKAQDQFSGHMSIDGRWSTPRNGAHGTVSAVDPINYKVLAFETVSKEGKNRPNGFFRGSSSNMETQGTKMIFDSFKNSNFISNVQTITKDRDNKGKSVYDSNNVSNLIRNDPRHYRTTFKRNFQKLISTYPVYNYIDENTGAEIEVENPFDDLEEHLERWLSVCLEESDDDTRVSKWISCIPHILGDHSNCVHSEQQDCFFWQVGLSNM